MKIYLILNDKVIDGYSYEKLANTVEMEIENPESIKVGIDTYENGNIISNEIPVSVTNRFRILELKKKLVDTDYLCLKHADGALTDEEYAETRAQRQAWRQEINELEQEQ